jgi:drug/metabolite transporter (DMT)-like permease
MIGVILMKMSSRTANLLLLLTSLLWGSGFITTKLVLDANITVGFLNFVRGFIFSVLALIIFHKRLKNIKISHVKVGLIAGLLNFAGFIAQCIGIKYTTPSNNAFITSTYVVIIPVLVWFFYKKPLKINVFISIILCMVGMAVLTGVTTNGFIINIGDLYTLICAFFFAASIAYIGYGSKDADSIVIAFMMAVVQTLGGFVYFIIVEKGQLINVDWNVAIIPLVYMGVLCSFTAQTLQVVAQRHTSATVAGIIMMLEGIFGSLFSVAFGFEPFTVNLAVGGLIITAALVIMELDFKKIKTKKYEHESLSKAICKPD